MNPLHLIGKLIPDESDIGDLARRLFALIVVSLIISALVLLAILGGAAWGEYKTRSGGALVVPDTAQERITYYRGVFDVCLAYTDDLQWCQGLVQNAIKNGWYETKSFGWDWADYK